MSKMTLLHGIKQSAVAVKRKHPATEDMYCAVRMVTKYESALVPLR
jgi:hypothetical protein